MKKKIASALLTICFMAPATSFGAGQPETPLSLNSFEEKLSYSMGFEVGNYFKGAGGDIKKELLLGWAAFKQLAGEFSILHLATDWQPLADHFLEVMPGSTDFDNLSDSGDYCERPEWRPYTKYEKRGERLGHEVRDLLYQRS